MIDNRLIECLLEALINRAKFHLQTSNAHLAFTVNLIQPLSQTKFGGVKSMILTTEEKVGVVVSAVTPAGNPARFDGVPVWASDDEAVAVVFPAVDSLSAEVHSVGFGQCIVTVTVDADLDVGEIRELTGMLDVTVVEPEAVTMAVTAGGAVLK